MKKITVILILLANYAFAEPVDSLVANVGKKAKIIFYGEKKEDLNEIGKYDLNLLYKELRKRAEKDFKQDEEVTLKEANEEFKNREANTTVVQKKWWNKMNLNVFVGVSHTEGSVSYVNSPREIMTPNYGEITVIDYFFLFAEPTTMLGIGGFYNKKIHKKKWIDLSLRYGGGFDLITNNLKTKTNSSFYLQNINNSTISIEKYRMLYGPLRSLNVISQDNKPYRKYTSPNLYYQFMPTISFKSVSGKELINLGIGIKASLNMRNVVNDEMGAFSSRNFDGNDEFSYKNKTIQTSWVFNLGYKYINTFIQIYPDISRTMFISKQDNNYLKVQNGGRMNTFIAGLRFGK